MEEIMRRQGRPLIVEVKHKRADPGRERSLWGGLDLAAIAAEATRDLERNELASRRFIDSDPLSPDGENSHSLQAEHHMADPQEALSIETVAEAPANVDTPEPRKRGPGRRQAKAEPARPVERKAAKPVTRAAEAPPAAVRTGRKVHSKEERAQKLGQIEKSVGQGGSLKSAVRQAGISEQTYYQWRKAAEPAAPAGDLKDLLALEEENERLKKLLAERLRKENDELKKKLGLK